MSSRKNPNAPAGLDVLTGRDLYEGMEVVIHRVGNVGNRDWQLRATVLRIGRKLQKVHVRFHSDGREETLLAADMGVMPIKGGWTKNYTTRLPRP